MRGWLLLFVLLGSFAAAQSDQAPYKSPDLEQVSAGRPLWQLDIRRNEPTKDFLGPRVVAGGERVFYLQGGQVKAVDAATGQQLWTFQVGRWAQLKYSSGRLLAVANGGKVVALEPRTGRVRWSRMGTGTFYAVDEKSLYIAEGEGLLALDLETGRTRWTTDEAYISPYETLTVSKHYMFIPKAVADAYSAAVYIYDARTGKRLGEASSRGPLAIIDRQAFFQNDWFQIDYPDNFYIDVHNLKTGKRLEHRTYRVENRVRGQDWNSKVAVVGAVYISGGGNIACFPLSAPGGKAKPNFIQVPRGDVQWLAGPHSGTFLLEWQGAMWLVQQNAEDSCAPIELLEQGRKVASGKLAHYDVKGNGLYLSLRNGMFYALDLRTGETVLKRELAASTSPVHVVGDTLVVQTGDELLAFSLPEEPKP